MDIFIIKTETANNIDNKLLHNYLQKKITDSKSMKEHTLAYLMLEKILEEVYKINTPKVNFVNNKPYLFNNEKFISLSHSNNYIVIAISDFECGIDTEFLKPRDYTKIAKRMKFKCNNINEFYFCWTKYEAEYKLNTQSKAIKQFLIEDYAITAVSTNSEEKFEIYIQK